MANDHPGKASDPQSSQIALPPPAEGPAPAAGVPLTMSVVVTVTPFAAAAMAATAAPPGPAAAKPPVPPAETGASAPAGAKPADAPARAEEKTPAEHKHRKLIIALSVAAAILAGIVVAIYYLRDIAPYESTDDAFIDGHVVSISPQVSALVASIHIDDNQSVHQGDVLVELDPTDYQVALGQARGSEAAAAGKLQQARAGVISAESGVLVATAQLDASQAKFENADLNLKHYDGLDAQARSQQDADTAAANRKAAAADVEQSKALLASARSQVISAQANVAAADGDYKKAEADTTRAEVNLGYCRVVAPSDGRITSKAVDPGDYVTPGNPLFQIVPVQVWITANFKETQLNYMRRGQPVTISVDAYSQMELRGKVDSIQAGTGSRFSIIPAENATGNFVKIVQRVPVKIVLDAEPAGEWIGLLAPGMSVQPKVRVR
jgi:membrane fusion protein (multidrug efflux system)